MNDRIRKQRELIAKKEGKFYTNVKDFQDRIKALPFEAGQNVWLQNSDSRKYEEAVIREKWQRTQLLHGSDSSNWTVLQKKQQLHQAKADRQEFSFYRSPADYRSSRDSSRTSSTTACSSK